MQYVQILSGTSTTPSFAPIRIRRPGNVQALFPLKPFTRKEALDAWLTDLKEKGIRLLFNGVEYLVWFQTSKKNFEIIAQIEVNFYTLLKRFSPKDFNRLQKEIDRARKEAPCFHGYYRFFAKRENFVQKDFALMSPSFSLSESLQLDKVPLVFVDTETTGVSLSNEDRITEIAALRLDPQKPPNWLISLFNPQTLLSETVKQLIAVFS